VKPRQLERTKVLKQALSDCLRDQRGALAQLADADFLNLNA
jgi:hypothetical protein